MLLEFCVLSFVELLGFCELCTVALMLSCKKCLRSAELYFVHNQCRWQLSTMADRLKFSFSPRLKSVGVQNGHCIDLVFD